MNRHRRSHRSPGEGAFRALAPSGMVLRRRGFDAPARAAIDELGEGLTPVSLEAVAADGDRATVPVGGRLGSLRGRLREGYGFSEEDSASREWWPQGITGAADAGPQRPAPGRALQIVSWYSRRGGGTRAMLVDLDARPVPRTRAVLLVRALGGGAFEPVEVHAGGIVWVGDLLHVVDTHRGIRSFDLTRMVRVEAARAHESRGHRYLLPEAGSHLVAGRADGLRCSFASLERPAVGAPRLLVGEYAKRAGGRLVRWELEGDTGLPVPDALDAHEAPVDRVQGAVGHDGELLASSSRPGGHLFAGRPGEPVRDLRFWPRQPQDLYLDAEAGLLWSLSELRGHRGVFAVGLEALA